MLTQARSLAAQECGPRLIPALVCLGMLAGCASRRAEVPAPVPAKPAVTAGPSIPPGATVYMIDADRSSVTLRVYRAGRLARLGHNHVITSVTETGQVWSGGPPESSGFELQVAVADLVVDDPAARAAAGPDFPGEVPEAARDGTRNNMLRPEVLDGERYPLILVRADSLGGTWEQPTVTARVTLRDQMRSIEVPLAIERSPDAIVARGAFRVLQSDFGITPFSIGGGAIAVADAVEVAFEIRAVRP